jgi:hypothetical protein
MTDGSLSATAPRVQIHVFAVQRSTATSAAANIPMPGGPQTISLISPGLVGARPVEQFGNDA